MNWLKTHETNSIQQEVKLKLRRSFYIVSINLRHCDTRDLFTCAFRAELAQAMYIHIAVKIVGSSHHAAVFKHVATCIFVAVVAIMSIPQNVGIVYGSLGKMRPAGNTELIRPLQS